ncbi:MAG TPA: type II toxin-antitoxin system HicB family antitoxin [bacterium]
MKYEIILEKEDDGRFSVHVPALPGCHSWGNSKEEAIHKIKEAIEGYLEVLNLRINDYRKVGESVEIEI